MITIIRYAFNRPIVSSGAYTEIEGRKPAAAFSIPGKRNNAWIIDSAGRTAAAFIHSKMKN
ncbi:hypothetical protein CRP01_07625 [Flavilitoribacter nigricans DSM 23189 = NBRC 102662]|uniref:Uncharacterized protein n=1 Tax=Flavilitoribacter nigricans (strain ATCC 23147 / DSM 23189 / NBRC 102662 / NCIMB 1420 / SS-2) TaxID=1122177 RepID=A0A2D0NF18_FLAN2|nr:hypothetical protein CRP01_07625 [Flavilitoribacter nigricans DSM 23189 = NBRC 102662]